MTREITDDFDSFITQDGKVVPIQDTDKMFSILVKRTEDRDQIAKSLRCLVEECLDSGYHRAACDYLEKILSLVDDPGERAECLLRMGLVMEEAQDFEAALEAYLRAFGLPHESNDVWYFLNNNTGFCLNQTAQCQEAERYCRAAIEIDPDRHNAYKNLGIALQNQGRYADAAENYIHASKLAPTDTRALALLEDLIAGHREILEEMPDLLEQLHGCHEAVQAGKGASRLQ